MGQAAEPWLSEEGPVEIMSALGYGLCVAVLFWLLPTWSGRWPAAGVLIFFMLRELDFHKRLTTMSILKSKFYLGDEVAMPEKLAGGAVVAVVLYLFYRLIRFEAPAWFKQLRQGQACAYGVLFAGLLILVSKSLDGLARKLLDVGILISEQASTHATMVEEVLELGIPIMIGLAIVCYARGNRWGD